MKFLVVLFAVPVVAGACPKGTEPFKDTCVVEIAPEIAPSVQPSDERPPDDKMPSYQREGIKIIDCPSTTKLDENADKAKAEADAEGKRMAGIAVHRRNP